MAKEFKIGEQILKVSDELEQYNELRYEFVISANKACDTFEDRYLKQNHDLDDVRRKVKEQVEYSLRETIYKDLRLLLEEGIYDVDKYIFIDDYCMPKNYLPVTDACHNVIAKCNAIDEQVEQQIAQREYNKQTRGRVSGGGFGFKGALSGMAMAGAMNMASGIAYSGVNVVTNWVTKRVANSEKRAVFKNPETLAELKNSLYESALNTHFAYIDVVEERTNKQIPKYDPANRRRAIAMHNNIAMLLPDKKMEEKIAVAMLQLNPYDEDFYRNIISNYGDSRLEVQAVADFFHVNIGHVKNDLIWQYVDTYSFEEIDHIDEMLEKVDHRAEYYGIVDKDKKNVLDVTFKRYCEWILAKWWKEDFALYLKWPEKREAYVEACAAELSAVKDDIKTLFDKYFGQENEYLYAGKDLPPNTYFSVSNNTEKKSQAIALCDDGIYYGEMMRIEYRFVDDIMVQNDTIIINQKIRIPLLKKLDQESLQAFLNEAVSAVKNHSIKSVSDLLELGEFITEKSSTFAKRAEEVLKENSEERYHIWRNVNLFNPANLAHVVQLNNIKVKLNVFQRKEQEVAPIFWLRSKEEYAVFETDGISFTENGIFVPYGEIKNLHCLDDEKIVFTYKGEEYVVFEEECDEWKMLLDFIDGMIKEFTNQGTCELAESIHKSQASAIMEPFMRWKDSYLLKRYGEDTRREFDYFLLMDCNSQSFTSFIDYFRKKQNLPADETFLAMVRGDFYSYDMLLIGMKNVYLLKEKSEESTVQIPLEKCEEIFVEFTDYNNKLKIRTADGKVISAFYIVDNEYVAERGVIANDILHKLLSYVKKYVLSNVSEEKEMPVETNLGYRYLGYAMGHSDIEKKLAVVSWKDSMKNIDKWVKKGMGEFLSASQYEKMLFFYNQRKIKASNVKIALTEKYLYVGGQNIFKVPVDDIKEIRKAYNGPKIELQVATKNNTYATSLGDSGLPIRISDYLSDMIFMLQEKKQEVLAITDLQEMEEERKKARRVRTGVYDDEHRDFVQKIAEYCASRAEEGLFDEEGPNLLLNDESEEFKQAYEEAVASSDEKPDPIEVPLFVIQTGNANSSSKSKFLSKRGKTLFATNEYWYNLGSGLGRKSARVPIRDICCAKVSEGKKMQKAKILAETADGNTSYQMPQGMDEFIEVYCEFYQLLIEELKNVIVDENISKEELEKEKQETKKMCGNVSDMSKEEILMCQDKLLDYSFRGSEEVEKQLEIRMKQLVEGELRDRVTKDMSIENLTQLMQELSESQEKQRYKRAVLLEIEDKIIEKKKQILKPKKDALEVMLQEQNAETIEIGVMDEKFRGPVTEILLKQPKAIAQIEVTDIPLVTSVFGKQKQYEGYILFENFMLIYHRGYFTKIVYNQIEKIILLQKMRNVTIAAVVNGKNVVITGQHKRENQKYATLISQMITYLKTGEKVGIGEIHIDLVTMEEQIDNAISKVNDAVSETINEKFGDQVETAKKVTGNIGSVFGRATKKAKEAGGAVASKGNSLSELGTKTCPDCGNKVKITSKFCGKCGHQF